MARPAPLSQLAVRATVRGGRAVGLFLLDLLVCLGRMVVPTICAAVALAFAVAVGQVLVAHQQHATAGYAVGASAVCIVAGLLAWASGWWSR